MTGSSTARATTATDSSIASRDTASPSGNPRAAAIDQLAVARARQPGAAATTRALAPSQTFTRTNGSGAACNRRSSSAFSRCVLIPANIKGSVPFMFGRRRWWTPRWGSSAAARESIVKSSAAASGTGRRRGGRGRRARSRRGRRRGAGAAGAGPRRCGARRARRRRARDPRGRARAAGSGSVQEQRSASTVRPLRAALRAVMAIESGAQSVASTRPPAAAAARLGRPRPHPSSSVRAPRSARAPTARASASALGHSSAQ